MLDQHLIARTRPNAASANVVLWKNYRVSVLSDRLFRVERSKKKKFRDEATQSVWFRDMPPQTFTVKTEEDVAEIVTAACTLVLKDRRADCRVFLDGRTVKISASGNLKGTYRTLDGCDGGYHVNPVTGEKKEKVQIGTGVCSRTGVAVFDDAQSLTLGADGEVKPERGDGSDEYVFAFGDDYRGAVNALYMITGKPPLVPRFALGNWWSRYREYTDKEYLRVLHRFEERDVPLTVATIDMDWHYSVHVDEQMGITAKGRNTEFFGGNSGWTGYSWNKELFPDYRAFLQKIRDKQLKITLNLHPADGVRWWEDCYEKMAEAMGRDASTGEKISFDIADTRFIDNYFSVVHKPYEAEGVDFWWIDWQQGTLSALAGLDPLWALNHYHYLDHAENHAEPIILSRYAGVGSHRYPLGFSGDTSMTWNTLKYLPYFTATASNVGYTWWSHDIGGHHFGEKNNEMYLRHLQFGVFSPVNRLHCTSYAVITKEPWMYGDGCGVLAEEWLRLRHRLIPFLYSCDYRTHEDGLALIEPLYYAWSHAREAYAMKDEYLFGGSLIVAPVTSPRLADGFARTRVWLPEGRWTDIFTGDCYEIPAGGAKKTVLRGLESVPVFAGAGAILPLSADKGNSSDNPESLEIRVWRGSGEFLLVEDGRAQGKTGRFDTRFVADFRATDGAGVQSLTFYSEGDSSVIPAGRRYTVRFEDISEGEIRVSADGEEIAFEETIADRATAVFNFMPGKKYLVEVHFSLKSRLQRLKERAEDVLIRAEENNVGKQETLCSLLKAETAEEFAALTDACPLSVATKARLKETL